MPSFVSGMKHLRYGRLVFAVALIGAIILLWKITPAAHYFSPQHIAPLFERLHASAWAIPAVIGIFILGTAVFFPLTILVLSVAIAFPPVEAFFLAFSGALCSAGCGYGLGRIAGTKFLRFFAGNTAEKISRGAKKGGVLGVTLLRLIPLAPLGVVDVSLGLAKVPFTTYLAGTVFGLLPGVMAISFLGNSLGRLWRSRNPADLLYVAAGVAVWIGVVVLSHFFVRHWQPGALKKNK